MRLRRGPVRSTAAATLVAVLGAMGLAACTGNGSTLSRPDDAVVLDGSAVPKLLGTDPMHVVGFAWTGSAWSQIPVQVDQRDQVNPGKILNRPAANWATLQNGSPYTMLVYTDPQEPSPGYTWWPTFTGVASHAGVGSVDEISFLAKDAGKLASGSSGAPAGVTASTQEQVKVTDPLHPSQVGYVYLFHSDTLTGGSAGTTGVKYTFNLTSGDYEATYKMGTAAQSPNNVAGSNPETSTIVTSKYSQTYGDRWLNNGISITRSTSTGANMLERSRAQVVNWGCSRSEDTFDDVVPSSPYEGGFIVNVSGPVRAIRSYIGANSGTYTAATDIFYPTREDSTIQLQVHPIPGVSAFDDLNTAAQGLTYHDDENPQGVTIDGTPDTLTENHPATWQLVRGLQGSLVTTRSIDSDIAGLTLSTYYLDQNPASPPPCTGDAAAWGQFGTTVVGPGGTLPCTDPTLYGTSGCPTIPGQATANFLEATRTRYFEPPSFSINKAADLSASTANPLQTTVSG